MKYRFAVVALLATICSYAQSSRVESPYVWKKVVSREIEFGGSDTKEKDKSGKVRKPVTLAKMMADAIGSGKAIGYSNLDMTLATRLTDYELDDILGRREERIEIVDPITGKEVVKVIKRDVDYSFIDRYRILEEWTFDPLTCKAQVKMLGLAPVRNIYGDDGVFRGVQGMFWLHYGDAKEVLDKYDILHPDKTVSYAIWGDNFSKPVRQAGNERQCFATRILDMQPGKEDDVKRHYKEQMSLESLSGLLYKAKYEGKIIGWAEFIKDFTTMLDRRDLSDKSFLIVDTIIITDPVTNQEQVKVISRFYDPKEYKVKVVQQWVYDRQLGKTEIEIVGLAPLVEQTNTQGITKQIPAFWVKYSDVQDIIAKNDEYAPANSLAMNLWNSYFLSDVKPEMMK